MLKEWSRGVSFDTNISYYNIVKNNSNIWSNRDTLYRHTGGRSPLSWKKGSSNTGSYFSPKPNYPIQYCGLSDVRY